MLCLSGFELYSRWVPLRSGKSDTVLLDEIKERVLHEDFDRTSESSVSIIIYVSRAIAELFEMKSVRKRLKIGDEKLRNRVFQGLRQRTETQTKADTRSHINTNAQQIAKPGWSVVKHTPNSMSFVGFENVRFDNQTVQRIRQNHHQHQLPEAGNAQGGISISWRKHFIQSL